jgi:hypothetical protein
LGKALDWSLLKRWAFGLVPLVGVIELSAHVVQCNRKVTDNDWIAAREYVRTRVRPEDLVVFAPRWVDPLGRQWFGDEIVTLAREARADETVFPRAFEVSIRGERASDLLGWREVERTKLGAVTVTTLANPSPQVLVDDLLTHVHAQGMRVARTDSGAECTWTRSSSQAGNLGFGPTIPAERFVCPGTFVGVSVVAVLDYTPRRCIYAPPPGGAAKLRLRFLDVAMGKALRGHHALYVEAERAAVGAPVLLSFEVAGKVLGRVVHRDGTGWTRFELDTSEWDGQRVELIAEIGSTEGHRRMYCFEASTRRAGL